MSCVWFGIKRLEKQFGNCIICLLVSKNQINHVFWWLTSVKCGILGGNYRAATDVHTCYVVVVDVTLLLFLLLMLLSFKKHNSKVKSCSTDMTNWVDFVFASIAYLAFFVVSVVNVSNRQIVVVVVNVSIKRIA